jgi:hypothetical protein
MATTAKDNGEDVISKSLNNDDDGGEDIEGETLAP